jgi:hypothetical protein
VCCLFHALFAVNAYTLARTRITLTPPQLTNQCTTQQQKKGAANGTARITVPFNRPPVCTAAAAAPDAAAASDACLWLSTTNATFPASSVLANALGWSEPEAGELT